MSLLDRTIAAEARAIEEGHRAYARSDGSYDVISDSFTDDGGRPLHFRVKPVVYWPHLAFYCDHPQVAGLADRPAMTAPGHAPCKHVALVLRRMEREGKARFVAEDPSGPWHTTEPDPLSLMSDEEREASVTDIFDRIARSNR